MKKGFTLVEILIAVMIMAVLVTMAFPLYEQAIEKSRISEVRTTLKKLHESKMRIMDSMDKTSYSDSDFGFENLDFSLPCTQGTTKNTAGTHVVVCKTKDFIYSLDPYGDPDAVCGARRIGDNKGVNFLFRGDLNSDNKFLCNNGDSGENVKCMG